MLGKLWGWDTERIYIGNNLKRGDVRRETAWKSWKKLQFPVNLGSAAL